MAELLNEFVADFEFDAEIFHSSKERQFQGEDDRYFQYSPKRIFLDEKDDIEDAFGYFVKELIIISFIKNMLQELGKDPDLYGVLKPKISICDTNSAYLRDNYLTISQEIFVPDYRVLENIASFVDENQENMKISPFASSVADLQNSGYDKINFTPFFLEGGNCVVLEDKKLMLIAVCNLFFENNKFDCGFFLNENGKIVKYKKYEEYCGIIKDWGRKIGYEVEIVDRNLEKFPIDELYHLDVFLNVADDVLVVDKDAVLPASFARLQKIFGDKIIEISKEDRQNLATNFIKFNEDIFLSNPQISRDFIDKLCDAGYNVVLPPFHFGIYGPQGEFGADGIRCHTQIAPKKTQTLKTQAANPDLA